MYLIQESIWVSVLIINTEDWNRMDEIFLLLREEKANVNIADTERERSCITSCQAAGSD